MNIQSGSGYPASSLSNFCPYNFIVDDIQCNSMEGFLQSLKYQNIEMQEYVCTLVGKQAKFKGKKKKWWKTQTLWWKGKQIDRHSKEYQDLLDKAYYSLALNNKFRRALLATGDANLTHSIGKRNPHETILTVNEFCGRLMNIRNKIQKGEL